VLGLRSRGAGAVAAEAMFVVRVREGLEVEVELKVWSTREEEGSSALVVSVNTGWRSYLGSAATIQNAPPSTNASGVALGKVQKGTTARLHQCTLIDALMCCSKACDGTVVSRSPRSAVLASCSCVHLSPVISS
jgi:hypothetical protein